jgi:hypothetical protein
MNTPGQKPAVVSWLQVGTRHGHPLICTNQHTTAFLEKRQSLWIQHLVRYPNNHGCQHDGPVLTHITTVPALTPQSLKTPIHYTYYVENRTCLFTTELRLTCTLHVSALSQAIVRYFSTKIPQRNTQQDKIHLTTSSHLLLSCLFPKFPDQKKTLYAILISLKFVLHVSFIAFAFT